MKIKIFTQNSCPNCPPAKSLGKILEKEYEVEWWDIQTIDGLTEASYFQVMATPSIILVDESGSEIAAWRGETPTEKKVKSQISKIK